MTDQLATGVKEEALFRSTLQGRVVLHKRNYIKSRQRPVMNTFWIVVHLWQTRGIQFFKIILYHCKLLFIVYYCKYTPCENCISSLVDRLPCIDEDLCKNYYLIFLKSLKWVWFRKGCLLHRLPEINKETLTMFPSLRGHSSGAVLNIIKKISLPPQRAGYC